MYSITQILANNELKLSEVAGPCAMVEIKMRILVAVNESLQSKVKEAIKNKKDEYWNCNLSLVDKNILAVFSDALTSQEKNKLKNFRDKRNKLMHADFVQLMKLMEVDTVGREILPNGKRNILKNHDLLEAMQSFLIRNIGFNEFKTEANEVNLILDKLIRLAEKK